MRWIWMFIFLNSLIISNLYASTYTGILPRDLSALTPLEGNAVSEFNNSDREIKRVYQNQFKITSVTGTYTASGTETVLIGSSTAAFTITFPAASTVGSSTCTKWMIVKNANTGTITVSATIDGVGTHTLSQNQVMSAFADASLWYRADMRNFSILSADEGTVTTLHADSIDADNGTFTAIRSGTANFTATTTVNGVSGLVDADVPNTITIDNATQITTRRLSDMQGLVDLGTQSTGAVTDAQVPNTITLDDATQITTRRLSDMQGKIGLGTQTDSPYLIKWRVGSTEGTGTLAFVAGAGISLSPIYSNGEGTITATAVGTASAGGWVDTGTQTQSTAGYPIDARGTITLRPGFGISGMTDADVPPDITLNNITQIATRQLSEMQGAVIDSQVSNAITLDDVTQITTRRLSDMQGKIDLGTQTNNTISLGTQTNRISPDITIDNMKILATSTAFVGSSTDTFALCQLKKINTYTPYPHDNNTLILYHMEEDFKDNSEYARDGSPNTGVVSHSNHVFGTLSKRFNINDQYGYTTLPSGSYWNFSGDFTLDFWTLMTSTQVPDKQYFLHQPYGGHDFYYQMSTNELYYENMLNNISKSGSWTVTFDTWYHVALVRSGDALNMYIDGNLIGGTTTASGAIAGCGTVSTYIGSTTSTLGAYLDEYRVSNSARWTTTFTPPTEESHSFYDKYNWRFLANGEEFMTIVTQGTETHFSNALLMGTTTLYGTSSYSLEALNILASTYDIRACSSNVKISLEVDQDLIMDKALQSLEASKVHKYLWNDPKDIRNNTSNYGIMIDDGCPPEILSQNRLPEITKWCGYLQTVSKALLNVNLKQQIEIDSLKEVLEKNGIK